MSVTFDHLVVAAASLEEGVAWCESTLGVMPAAGGRHPLMGTHNRLMRLSDEAFPDSFLEIIAIDPDAAPPHRRRWFGLDDPAVQASLGRGPRLIHVVARSSMLDMHRWGLINVGCHPGDPVAVTRQTPVGPLSWQMLLRDDAALPCGAALPTLIQWQGRHPAPSLPDAGIRLRRLELAGVPPRAREVLRLRGVAWSDGEASPALRATLSTPRGEVVLDSA